MINDGKNGHRDPVDPEHAEWLEKVIAAVDVVIEEGVDSDDPWRKQIIEDAIKLRERLVLELSAAARPQPR